MTAAAFAPPLSHDPLCSACGHAAHSVIACSDSCACVPQDDDPPAP